MKREIDLGFMIGSREIGVGAGCKRDDDWGFAYGSKETI